MSDVQLFSLWLGDYECSGFCGVYSTLELAQQAARDHADNEGFARKWSPDTNDYELTDIPARYIEGVSEDGTELYVQEYEDNSGYENQPSGYRKRHSYYIHTVVIDKHEWIKKD